MTFDEAIKILGEGVFTDSVNFGDSTFVSKHEITNLDMIQIINDLRKEYAPTINMTKEQYIGLLFKGKGRETSHKNFVFMKDVQKLNEKQVSITSLMNAFVHPETIKVIGELSEEEED